MEYLDRFAAGRHGVWLAVDVLASKPTGFEENCRKTPVDY
jgi:hypothetical protein